MRNNITNLFSGPRSLIFPATNLYCTQAWRRHFQNNDGGLS